MKVAQIAWVFILVVQLRSTFALPTFNLNAKKSEVSEEEMKIEPEGDVLPPNHLDAVKLDRGGNFNKDFHKEVFLGEKVEDFQKGKESEQRQELKDIFKMIDRDSSKTIQEDELADWVQMKTIEHFKEAKESTQEVFTDLDINGDALLSWDEFLLGYLTKRGFDKEMVVDKIEKGESLKLNPHQESELQDVRDKWRQQASQLHNGSVQPLKLEEFLFLQHPETSEAMIHYMVEDFLHDIDMDADDKVSLHEFLMMEKSETIDEVPGDLWQRERKKEFTDVLDINNDGIATKEELMAYVNPLNKAMPHQEARQLIGFGDDNEDGVLSLEELLDNSEYFTGSKLYNYAKNIHDDL